jgi:hypothetical protein
MTNQLIIKMVLDSWNSYTRQVDNLLDKLTDEQLQNEVSPGRNRGIYLLGHLTAVHDRMLPLLNLEDQLFPELADSFISNADKTNPLTVSAGELRQYWKKVNSTLKAHFNSISPDDWFKRHNTISAEDFQKEPHRNRLSIIINRTNHLSYHTGQLAYLKK